MMRGRNKVNIGDKIYAVLTIDGETVVKFSDNCFGSLRDVISAVFRAAGRFVGVARLLIRNQSEGWNVSMPLASNAGAQPRVSAPVAANGQYLIPW